MPLFLLRALTRCAGVGHIEGVKGEDPKTHNQIPSKVGLGGRRKQSSLASPGAREMGGMTDPHDGSIPPLPVL